MADLEFRVGDLERELEAIKELASKFLAPEAPGRLDQFRYQLRALVAAGGGSWSIPLDEPVATKPTRGYGGAHDVWAEVTATWDLKRVPKTQLVRLSGIASTRVSLFRQTEHGAERLAMWRMEIGRDESPGCYFHTHVLGDTDELPYPAWLPVRFAGLIPTPAAALEFVLAELWQLEWTQYASRSTGGGQLWARLQKQRLAALFAWHTRVVGEEGDQVIPWTALKRAKPDAILVRALAQ
jgi:hypothetical protein